MSDPLPYDVSWELLSVSAESPEEAAQQAMAMLQQELADTGRLRFVVQQPDANDAYSEVDVTPNGEVLAPCSQCGDEIDPNDPHAGYGMCASCLHDALRSGWDPHND